jgi:hypothetical protein
MFIKMYNVKIKYIGGCLRTPQQLVMNNREAVKHDFLIIQDIIFYYDCYKFCFKSVFFIFNSGCQGLSISEIGIQLHSAYARIFKTIILF